MTEDCIRDGRVAVVIPALKKNAVIPDQLVKKLAGKTLIERALETATGFVPAEHVHVVTDSEEISQICRRAGVRFLYDPARRIDSLDIVAELREVLTSLARTYEHLVIYRASCPLMGAQDIRDAYHRFAAEDSDCLVTLKSVRHRFWRKQAGDVDTLLFDERDEDAYIETKSLLMLRREALALARPAKVTPYFCNDRAIEINSYQDWWLCEKLLARRHIVFVVAGYPAIGMGHVFRSLMLAHEIADHKISFLCTRESELAAANIAARDYRTHIQQGEDLAGEVLALAPDLVVNDMLNTTADYVTRLQAAGARVVTFEDLGSGAAVADLVVNALYDRHGPSGSHVLYGYRYFCLRDEFLAVSPNPFRHPVKRVLVTFGGTDHSDFTRQTLQVIGPLCRQRNIALDVVTGPGYAHRDSLEAMLASTGWDHVSFTAATNVISGIMEGADLAVCSAGRTVYELAHMRLPAIVLAHHQREAMHTFARPGNGFRYLGCMGERFDAATLRREFLALLDEAPRRDLHAKQARFDFRVNKDAVVRRILALLDTSSQSLARPRPLR